MTVPPHPEPSPDLQRRHLPIIAAQQDWWRLHRCIYGAVYFGKSGANRFDALEPVMHFEPGMIRSGHGQKTVCE